MSSWVSSWPKLPAIMKICVLSDTHIPVAAPALPPDLLRALEGADLATAAAHAGWSSATCVLAFEIARLPACPEPVWPWPVGSLAAGPLVDFALGSGGFAFGAPGRRQSIKGPHE